MVLITNTIYLFIIFINILGFLITYHDKTKSIKSSSSIQRDRISEKIFYFLVFFGSSLGVIFSIIYLRHKTIKHHFQFNLMISLIFHFSLVFIIQFQICVKYNKMLGNIFLLFCIVMLIIFLIYYMFRSNSNKRIFYIKKMDSVYLKINFQLSLITMCLWIISFGLNNYSDWLLGSINNNTGSVSVVKVEG